MFFLESFSAQGFPHFRKQPSMAPEIELPEEERKLLKRHRPRGEGIGRFAGGQLQELLST